MSASSSGPAGIVLLCGRAYSGKSTVASTLVPGLPATLVSLDAINAERGPWGGDGISIEEWSRTNEIARDRTVVALRASGVVVVDDTSSPRFLRDGWRSLARDQGVGLALIYVDTSVDESVARQAANRSDPTRPDVRDDVMRASGVLRTTDRRRGSDPCPAGHGPG